MVSEEGIKKFQTLYKKHFGKEISMEDAYQSAAKLIRLVEIIYKPMTKREMEIVLLRQAKITKELSKENKD